MAASFDFSKDKVVVTGATKGIGRAIAEQLHAAGAVVYAVGRDEETLFELQRRERIKAFKVDLSNTDDLIKFLNEECKNVNMLVNNAGIVIKNSILNVSTDDLDQLVKTNLRAPMLCSQKVAQHIIAKGSPRGGAIVNISSIRSLEPTRSTPLYSMSKAAVDCLTKSSAQELGKHRIRVNAVRPGFVVTDINSNIMRPDVIQWIQSETPLGEIVQTEQIAKATLFLLSDAASGITGECLTVDGGMTAGRTIPPRFGF
eukprot:GHVS01064465.1.p1 GENE.GHVS01064465.1~~GHVS01064465.1.p1  ORF type:complete len:257 (-),score=20.64 GHVS01064465.1:1315-2085(-)